jgi:predicted nucleic acid-binding protein
MNVADLVAGDSVFVDANILVYHFGPHPTFGPACHQLIQRIEQREVHGFTSTHILGEVAHQLMIGEAANLPGWGLGKVKQRLQQQPAVPQNLSQFRTAIESVLQSSLGVLTIAPSLLGVTVVLSQQHSLLTNDALTIALMQANGLTNIASHDTDFDRVPGIARFGPV